MEPHKWPKFLPRRLLSSPLPSQVLPHCEAQTAFNHFSTRIHFLFHSPALEILAAMQKLLCIALLLLALVGMRCFNILCGKICNQSLINETSINLEYVQLVQTTSVEGTPLEGTSNQKSSIYNLFLEMLECKHTVSTVC